MLRLLIADGNDREGRRQRADAVGRTTSEAYAAVMDDLAEERGIAITRTLVCPADADAALPPGTGLGDFDGMILTGSTLRVSDGTPAVRRQFALMRAAFAAGLPSFGSCWGMQVAACVAGGRTGTSPRGPEYGIARRLIPTEAGAGHPMLAGKGPAWDAPAIHADAVLEPPPGARVLAANACLDVQAIEIRHGDGVFWGTQYHPETDLDELAATLRMSAEAVVEAGFCPDTASLETYAKALDALHGAEGSQRRALAWRHGLGPDLLEAGWRRREIGNALAHLAARRGRR